MDDNQFTTLGSEPDTHSKKKKLFIIGAVIAILLIGVAIFVALSMGSKKKAEDDGGATSQPPSVLTATASEKPVEYAGSAVYDACDVLSLDTVKRAVPEFAKEVEAFGRGETSSSNDPKAKKPLPISIGHHYIDRSIPQPLGRDGDYRTMLLSLGSNGAEGRSMETFISLFNAHCVYGQDVPVQSTIASVFVTQPPTPFTPEFMPYLETLSKSQVEGMDVYQTSKGAMKYAAVVKPDRKVAVILQTDYQAVLDAGVSEIVAKIAQAPKGPVEYTYPGAYFDLVSPCSLLDAGEFEQFTGRPASAVTNETLTLANSKELGVDRSCQRLEADRFKGDVNEIAESIVMIRQAKTTDEAALYIQGRLNSDSTIKEFTKSSQALGDESFVAYSNSNGMNPQLSYTYVIRIGGAIVEVKMNKNKQGYSSSEEFEQQVAPVAKKVVEKYRQALAR